MSHPLRSSCAVSLACAVLLAACGGGDGAADTTAKNDAPAPMQPAPAPSTPSGVSTPYVGSWSGCAAASAATSWSGSYEFTRVSDTQADYHFVRETFNSADCSGAVVGTLSTDGKVTWTGKTRTVAGVAADEVQFVPLNFRMSGSMTFTGSPTAPFKQVLAIAADELREGDRAQLDADGYPVGFSAIRYTGVAPPPPPPPPAVAPPPPPPAPPAQ